MWKNLNNENAGLHYSIFKKNENINGIDALKSIFEDGECNDLNFVLFSTSGVHGSYNTIEDAEVHIKNPSVDTTNQVTFLVIQPRLVAMRYGNCYPENQNDIDFLKKLRESSNKCISLIGF